jgi:hypothetical protein
MDQNYYSMHLQFKPTFSGKLQENEIKWRNIANNNEIVPNLNMLFMVQIQI